MTKISRILTFFVLALALLAGPSVGEATAKKKHHVTFGAWTPGSPFGGDLGAIDRLQGSLQRRVGIVNWYQDWTTDASHFRWNVTKAVKGIQRSGRKAMLTWEPYRPGPWEAFSNQAITNGTYDDYIRFWARGVARLKTPIYVRFAHEMNGNWYNWGGPVNGNSSSSFKAMWRHVVDISRSVGATNIKWVWSPLTENVPYNSPTNKFQQYYPGRSYVDVLALDGYNWGASTPQYGGWRTFKHIFMKPYKKIVKLGPQPVWIAEIGSASDGGDKGKWVRKMFKVASSQKMKRLKAIVWYNQDKERDWSTASAASAFRG